jgi:hypothetical protein
MIAEGEFKALALCEEGIPAVAIGGISSAMPKGKLLPDLAKLLRRYNPHTVYFLGDADTCLIFEFSLEATKIAKALPGDRALKLPRVPLSMPNAMLSSLHVNLLFTDSKPSIGSISPAPSAAARQASGRKELRQSFAPRDPPSLNRSASGRP